LGRAALLGQAQGFGTENRIVSCGVYQVLVRLS